MGNAAVSQLHQSQRAVTSHKRTDFDGLTSSGRRRPSSASAGNASRKSKNSKGRTRPVDEKTRLENGSRCSSGGSSQRSMGSLSGLSSTISKDSATNRSQQAAGRTGSTMDIFTLSPKSKKTAPKKTLNFGLEDGDGEQTDPGESSDEPAWPLRKTVNVVSQKTQRQESSSLGAPASIIKKPTPNDTPIPLGSPTMAPRIGFTFTVEGENQANAEVKSREDKSEQALLGSINSSREEASGLSSPNQVESPKRSKYVSFENHAELKQEA